MFGRQTRHLPHRVVALTFATCALSILAILLWGRIKLVAGVPRTAYAEPNAAPAPQPLPRN